jgi:hypothetical protein
MGTALFGTLKKDKNMKMKFLSGLLCASLLLYVSQVAYADENGRIQLQNAATGPEFMIAKTAFRLVPAAAVNKLNEADADPEDVRIAAAGELARIGPYSISLGGGTRNAANSKRALDAVEGNASYGVAMNQRSGAPVLVAPRLKVYCKETAQANALAQAAGGEMLMASAPAQLIFLGYSTPAAALAAIPLLKKQPCVRAVEADIIQSFAVPN